jgi:hypothetical protein
MRSATATWSSYQSRPVRASSVLVAAHADDHDGVGVGETGQDPHQVPAAFHGLIGADLDSQTDASRPAGRERTRKDL